MIINSYNDFLIIEEKWQGDFCIFGAGRFGSGYGYELLCCAGIKIAFYLDNAVEPGTEVRDGVLVKKPDYLYTHKDDLFVFICMGPRQSAEVEKQLNENDIRNYAVLHPLGIDAVLESVDHADEEVKRKYWPLYDNREYLIARFKRRVGYEPNLEHPKTFNEKLQWLKLNYYNERYTDLVDKYAFKQYVTESFGSEYVIPLLGAWNCYDEIDFSQLPEQFVLKCTHDSGSVVVVNKKTEMNHEDVRRKLSDRLGINYYWEGREWPYRYVKRRIIAEEYIGDDLTDYKFMCFDGKVKCMFTCTERFSKEGLKVTFFDPDFQKMEFSRHYPVSTQDIQKPVTFEDMKGLAEKISQGIPFVRVDFLERDNEVYFGEMTFFPGGGMEEFDPPEWDRILGDMLHLPKH